MTPALPPLVPALPVHQALGLGHGAVAAAHSGDEFFQVRFRPRLLGVFPERIRLGVLFLVPSGPQGPRGGVERVPEAHDFRLTGDEGGHVHLFHEVDDLLHLLVDVAAVIAHHREGEGGLLPEILIIHLRHGHVEAGLHPLSDPAENLTFGLEGTALRNLEGQTRDTDKHDTKPLAPVTTPSWRATGSVPVVEDDGRSGTSSGWAASPRSRRPR